MQTTHSTQDMVSFVLRFVREAGQEQEARWRGIIKHVQSNDEAHFSHFVEALDFMQAHVNEVVNKAFAETAEPQTKNPFLETTRLWGEYMPQYTELMFDTVKETMTTPFAGTPMAQQVEDVFLKTWAAWGLSTPKEQEQTADQLESLLGQLAALQEKVKELESQIAQQSEKHHKDEVDEEG
jgi:polyhydroxyalkanoate synthesis regulator protein